jgi:hypothetical protein
MSQIRLKPAETVVLGLKTQNKGRIKIPGENMDLLWYAKLDFSRTNEWVVNKKQIQPQLMQLQELLA